MVEMVEVLGARRDQHAAGRAWLRAANSLRSQDAPALQGARICRTDARAAVWCDPAPAGRRNQASGGRSRPESAERQKTLPVEHGRYRFSRYRPVTFKRRLNRLILLIFRGSAGQNSPIDLPLRERVGALRVSAPEYIWAELADSFARQKTAGAPDASNSRALAHPRGPQPDHPGPLRQRKGTHQFQTLSAPDTPCRKTE
jgi:hypothetical protein